MIRGKLHIMKTITVLAVAVILLCGGFHSYSTKLHDDLRNTNYDFLSKYSLQDSDDFRRTVNVQVDVMKALARNIGAFSSIEDNRAVQAIEYCIAQGSFLTLSVTSPNGTTSTYNSHKNVNVADTEYFKLSMRGQTYISNPSIVKEQSIITFAVPIYNSEDDIKGVLSATYNSENLNNIFKGSSYENGGHTYIVSVKGQYIAWSETNKSITQEANFLRDTEKEFHIENGADGFQAKMEAGKEGVLLYTQKDIKYAAYYMPVGINNWYILSVVPEQTIEDQANIISHNVEKLIFVISLSMIMIAAFFLYYQSENSRTIKKSREQLNTLVGNIPGGVVNFYYGEEAKTEFVNEGYLHLLGYTREQFEKEVEQNDSLRIYKDDQEWVNRTIEHLLSSHKHIEIEYRTVKRSGEVIWVLLKGRRISSQNSKNMLNCVLVDITGKKQVEKKLRISEERYRIVANLSESIIFEYSMTDERMDHTENYRQIFGEYPVMGTLPDSALKANIIYPEDIPIFCELCEKVHNGVESAKETIRMRKEDRDYLWCEIRIITIFDDNSKPLRVIGTIKDIDMEKKKEEALKLKTMLDPLTGMYNKIATQCLIDDYLKDSEEDKKHAIMEIDIDNFKRINDTMGHITGDAVLTDVSCKIKELFRSSDIVGRIGGDEFIIFLKDVPSIAFVEQRAKEVLEQFNRTFCGENCDYKVSGSIGISMFPENGKNYIELLQRADSALYYAKHNGKDTMCIFNNQTFENEHTEEE